MSSMYSLLQLVLKIKLRQLLHGRTLAMHSVGLASLKLISDDHEEVDSIRFST